MAFKDLNMHETLGARCQDPITMLIVASTAVQAISTIGQGIAAKDEYDYQATIEEQNAETSRQQNQANIERQDRQRRMRMGSSLAAASASGVGSQSFSDTLQSSAAQEELDLLTIKSEGLLEERNFLAESSLLKSQGRNAMTSGYLGAASSILSGASKMYGGGSGGLGNQKIEASDYLSSGARKDISYAKGGGQGPYRF